MASNEILALSEAEHRILHALQDGLTREEAVRQLAREHGIAEAETLVADFESDCAAHGWLLPVERRPLAPMISAEKVRETLEHRLRTLNLNVTEECDFRCRYCVFGGTYPANRRHSSRRMSTEVALRAVDFLLARSDQAEDPLSFCFYGGEPLLELPLIERVAGYLREKLGTRDYGLHLTTNGAALRRPEVRAFLAAKKVSLLVSLDGPARIHDRWRVTRDGHQTHALIEEGLGRLLDAHADYYREHVMFAAVLTPPVETCAVTDYFLGSPLFLESTRQLRLSAVDRDTDAFDGLVDSAAAAAEVDEARRAYIENRARDAVPHDGLNDLFNFAHAKIAQRKMRPLPERVLASGFCIPGGRKLFVSVDGTLGMCEKVQDALPIGQLERGFDFEGIQSLLEELRSLWSSSCSLCAAQRFCGICPAMLRTRENPRGLSREAFERECEAVRSTLPASLCSFLEICERNPAYLDHMKGVQLS